jgi:hypothetical protein
MKSRSIKCYRRMNILMHDDEIEYYGDEGIATKDLHVPHWLFWIYFLLPIWGILTFYVYWNGSYGWLDRGYWHELQKAANTTVPQVNYIQIEQEEARKT